MLVVVALNAAIIAVSSLAYRGFSGLTFSSFSPFFWFL